MARWLALIAVTQQVACGGKTSTAAVTADPPPAPSVTLSPSSAQISAGGNVQFIVTVQNAANPAVTWQVNGIPAGNSLVGTITAAGAATASYVAPANVAATMMVTVSAVLQANGTTSGSATVTVNPPPVPEISISPANPSVVAGTGLELSATVENGPQAVIWEVNGLPIGNATIGTITSPLGSLTALYNAPAQIPNPSVVTISAVLTTNVAISGSTNITIIPPATSVSISPSTANLVTNQTLQFDATVQNSNAGVTWEVNNVPGGNSTVGTIVPSDAYAATYTAPANPGSITITAVLQTNSSIFGSAGVTIILPSDFAGVYSWRNDASLTGQNTQEKILTATNVNPGQFGKLYGCPVDGQIYAQPLYVSNVAIPDQGTFDVVYVATENDSIYAFNAQSSSCQTFWQTSFVNAAEGVATVPAGDLGLQTDIGPVIGITGTPVIDPATATLFVIAKTKESSIYVQRLHALDLTTGAEKFGGPAVIHAQVNGTGDGSGSFDPLTENQRSALLLAGGHVYIAFDSYEDTDPVHGWLFAYSAANLTQAPTAVFNSTPNGSHGGIGGSGAAPTSDGDGNIFVTTSDGTFDAGTGGNDYAESLLRLNANSVLTVADRFTPPAPGIQLLGTNGVMLLPAAAGSPAHPNLAVAGSQSGSLYLVDRDNLTKDGALATLCFGASASVTGTAAYWNNVGTPTIYVGAAGSTLGAFPVVNGSFSSLSCATPSSQSPDVFDTYGASPVISSNGISNGIVWALDNSGYTTGSTPAILHAYDATNLGIELFASPANASDPGAAGPAVKFAVPTVANGMVYVGTQNELSVFGLLP